MEDKNLTSVLDLPLLKFRLFVRDKEVKTEQELEKAIKKLEEDEDHES